MVKKTTKTNKTKLNPVTLRNVKLLWRNFEGRKGKFNAKGERSFHVVLDPETASIMRSDGWNVRLKEPREDGDNPLEHIEVKVSFDNYPPRILMKTGDTLTPLDGESVAVLDWTSLRNVNVMLSPYLWEVNGKSGISAYLKKLTVELDPDDIEAEAMGVGGAPMDDISSDEI